MNDLKTNLQEIIKGEILDSEEDKVFYSHDASMFEMRPDLVVCPKDSEDIKSVVQFVSKNKAVSPKLSLTVRSGGTCMSGGSINDSIVLDFSKHINQIISVDSKSANAQPGVYYRDFEKATLEHGVIMPSYPASRDLCTIGGMVANNAGGEKSLEFGKTEEFVEELKVVFADGNEYVVRALNKSELDVKMAQNDFEGNLYRQVFELVDGQYDEIKAAKPGVSKDSTGYHMWDVWDRETGIFDMTRLITGSQGTLGIVTDIKFKL
ncbi:MAG: FAD-binding oxidoreductase, partial [Candidatus Saccharibacteria bacterium]|nr:FAD-binding oxidoreductase [Candidatus Saccharibacteria bacterium]